MTVSNNLLWTDLPWRDSSDATRSAEWANTGEKYPNGRTGSRGFHAEHDDAVGCQQEFYAISIRVRRF